MMPSAASSISGQVETLGTRWMYGSVSMKTRDRVGFFAQAREQGADMVVLDIPLLFETGGHANVDAVVVVSAPPEMQRERVLARPGMSPDRLDAILAQQMADAEKRARAHFVVDTGRGLEAAREQVLGIIAELRASGG